MESIDDLIYAAWKRVWPTICDRPEEIAKRIARRRTGELTRPPRAWCLALRANDRRIPSWCDEPEEHRVRLDADEIKQLCMEVELQRETLKEASEKLGSSAANLVTARISGRVRADYVEGLGGRWGHPIPLLMTDEDLDPGARGWRPSDEIWGWTGRMVWARMPADLELKVMRVPRWGSHASKHRYDDSRHPELDDAPPPGPSRRLPKPLADPACWYKYSR